MSCPGPVAALKDGEDSSSDKNYKIAGSDERTGVSSRLSFRRSPDTPEHVVPCRAVELWTSTTTVVGSGCFGHDSQYSLIMET